MIEQLDLQFTRRGRRILAQRGGLDRFLHVLASANDWLSAGSICRELGLTPTEHNKRWLRLLAENSDGQIISGQLGYRLTTLASIHEIEESASWLEHQARRMADRARAIRRRAHRAL